MKIKKIYSTLLIVFFQLSFSQLSDFNLQVSAMNETCPGNGTLSFTVSNTTAGASIIYNIFLLPNITTPISTTSNSSLTGLISGNYKVVATQSLGVNTNSQQQNSTIVNQIVNLNFDLVGENEVCGNDGKITVNVTQGNAVSYEIFSGPMLRPLQASNVFTGLTLGTYQVRVFDNCGEGVVKTIVVEKTILNIDIRHQGVIISQCDSVYVADYFESFGPTIISYPIQVEYVLTTPSGSVLSYSQTIISGDPDSQFTGFNLPLYYNQSCSYIIKVIDSCGNLYISSPRTINAIMNIGLRSNQVQCDDRNLEVRLNNFGISPFTINFISAPSGFNPLVYNSSHPQPNYVTYATYYNSSIPLPAGFYDIEVTDACGRISRGQITIVFDPPPTYPLDFYQLPGCELGYGSVRVANNRYGITQAEIVSAPIGYPYSLPHNVTNYIYSPDLYLEHLLPGSYTFKTTDGCGSVQFSNVEIVGYEIFSSLVNVIEQCNSFSIELDHETNLDPYEVSFWLQKFNPLTNEWGHPITNVTSPVDYLYYSNAILLNNNSINNNFTISGKYRVMKLFSSYLQYPTIDGNRKKTCIEQIYDFNYSSAAIIKNVYTFSCANGTYDVIVDAIGFGSLHYRITTKNGLPFLIDNGTSNLFAGLSPAIYDFQVEDSCGNITNRIFEINNEIFFSTTPSQLCGGQNGSLSVPYFSFLHYEWWKGNDTSTILSISNSLQFTPFSTPNDFGLYHVRVTNPSNSSSCINLVLDYEISPSLNNPNAGNDSNVSYCGNQGTVNLFSLLTGSYMAGGTWEEITNSGALNNNLWNSSSVAFGTYSFKYKVNGLCGNFDESQVEITINEIPATPIASIDPFVCMSGDLNLYASNISGVIYQWTGPNGFNSTLQNPILTNISSLNNGVYTVKTIKQGCESGLSSVNVVIESLPDFYISETCENNVKTLTALPLSGTFDSTINFNWTGPNGFTSSLNPIQINDEGNYVLTIDKNTCEISEGILVTNTACEIPKGISPNGDGLNDYFDLSSFDVKTIKIFNRYGLEVYSKNGYLNEWYGQANNGNILPDATYFYVLKLNSGESKTGWVYLIR